MPPPISPPPLTERQPATQPAYLSNGMLGLRVRDMPLLNGVAVLNGYAGKDPETRVEAAPYAPYPLGGDIRRGHIWLSEMPEAARLEEQSYDFAAGELHTRFSFSADGASARVRVLTFCSRTQPTLALQQITVTVDAACDLALRVTVDPTGIPGTWFARMVRTPGTSSEVVDGSLRWESLGAMSTCGVAYVTELQGADDAKRTLAEWHEQGPLATTYAFRAHSHHRYLLRQISSMVPEAMHHSPDHQAMRMAWFGGSRGFHRLRQANREVWADLWRGRVHVLGAERRWQEMADSAFYYLHASVHPSSPSSTSPFGLAEWYNYHYYYGHILWDLETVSEPPLLLTYSWALHAMLDYRAQRLPAARSNARMFGCRGLQFPWQSSINRGEESTLLMSPHSSYEQHVTLDVAFAFAQYGYATDDAIFRRDSIWPVLRGAAEWLESRVTKTARGYEIQQITGPSEETGPVDNNAYVNMAACIVLRAAVECAERLGYEPPPAWERIAQGLVIPKNPSTHVILNYDGYAPEQSGGAAPSAAAGFYPLTYTADPQTERATLEYYLDLAPRFIGTPMFSPLYGVFAAWLGDRKRALQMFEKGYADFIQSPFSSPGETPANSDQPLSGSFFANLGGFLTGCLFGLLGLRIGPGEPAEWCARPVVMPQGWDGIEVERIWVRGQPAHLLARHGDERARIEPLPEEA